jgi:hypothetical protein
MKPIKNTAPRQAAFKGIRRDDPSKFWLLTEQAGDCLIWTGSKYPNGYGLFAQNKKRHLAHRHAFVLSIGPIPEGMLVDHTCHNKACVNPEHLRLATVKQNQENLGGLKANNTSGYRGVSRARQGWRATLTHEGRSLHLGTFPSKEEAAEAIRIRRLETFTHNDLDRTA